MAEQALILESFEGGIARVSEKKDIPNSARFVQNLDVYSDPASLTPFQKATKESGTTITALPKWMVDGSPFDTNKYLSDASGNIYKRTSGGSWSLLRAGSAMTFANYSTTISYNPGGQGLATYADYLYYANGYSMGRYGPLSIGPSFDDNFLNTLGTYLKDQESTATGFDYTVKVALSEAVADWRGFTPSKNPIWFIRLLVAIKGTGSLTLTLHDAFNNTIATKTIVNADIPAAGNTIDFVFTTPVEVVAGNNYHFHVTSTVADTDLATSINLSLAGAYYQEFTAPLVSDSDWHPMLEHLNLLVIGNGRYLATWDVATYNPNKIVFPPGFKVRALGKDHEFLVAACWRSSTIDGQEEGRLYYWDGIAPTYNFYKILPMGLPNALSNNKNRLIGVYGSSGNIYLGSEPFQRVQTLPKLPRANKVEIYPDAFNPWQGLTMMGVAGSTDDGSNLMQGVYAWGSRSDDLPEAFSLVHTLSTGTTQGTSLKVGMVKGFGKDLFIGWQDGANYGVDKVTKTDNPAASGSWESLIFDHGSPMKSKLAFQVTLMFQPLVANESITPKYRINRATSWTSGSAVTMVGATTATVLINKRFREIEFGFDFATTATSFLKVTQISLTFDDLQEEDNES